MQQPIEGEGTRVLKVKPDIRAGTKCAFFDDTGKYLAHIVIYNRKIEEAKKLILEGIRRYDIQLVAVENGAGDREAREIIASLIADNGLAVQIKNTEKSFQKTKVPVFRKDDDGTMYNPFAEAFRKKS